MGWAETASLINFTYIMFGYKAVINCGWPVPEWQLVHISNGRESFNDPHHSDLITVMPSAYRNAPWIEVEAKLKEEAIEKLRVEWISMAG